MCGLLFFVEEKSVIGVLVGKYGGVMRFEARFSVSVDEFGRVAHEFMDHSLLPMRYRRLTIELDEPIPRRQIGYAIVMDDDRVVHAAAVVEDRLRVDLDLPVSDGDHTFWFLCAGLDPRSIIKGRAIIEGDLDMSIPSSPERSLGHRNVEDNPQAADREGPAGEAMDLGKEDDGAADEGADRPISEP